MVDGSDQTIRLSVDVLGAAVAAGVFDAFAEAAVLTGAGTVAVAGPAGTPMSLKSSCLIYQKTKWEKHKRKKT